MTPEVLAFAAERLGADAEGVLARLAGRRARALTKHERVTLLVAARSPVPPGLRLIDPSWIEAGLAGLPPRARAALDAPSSPVDVWLARWATSALPPMPLQPTTELDRLVGHEVREDRGHGVRHATALAWLLEIAEDQLAFALGEAYRPLARGHADEVFARIARPPRAGNLGSRRAAIERVRMLAPDDDRRFLRLGCRALAPHLATNRLAQLQISRSLPRHLGLLVEQELVAFSALPLDQVPAWPALVAR